MTLISLSSVVCIRCCDVHVARLVTWGILSLAAEYGAGINKDFSVKLSNVILTAFMRAYILIS